MADVTDSSISGAISSAVTSFTSNSNGNGVKKKMSGVFGVILVITVVGYLAMAIFSQIRWNDATSGALIMGFALFANKLVDNFTKWMEN